ncbi:MAG: hypothetical protein KGM44_08900 [bacterium]|nr:hypothetical protein [bacterium]
MARAGLTLLIALALAAGLSARAGAYRILHVEALSIGVDRTRVQLGEQLHLTVRAVVRDRVPALPELVLPDLSAFQVTADAQRYEHAGGSTTYIAVLTIVPNLPGRTRIRAAHIDAIDPRTHQALRYSSNTLVVQVSGRAPGEAAQVLRRLRMLLALNAGVVIAIVIAALWLLRTRRGIHPIARQSSAGELASSPPQLLPADERLAHWVSRLRQSPTRATATAARAALWERLGAQRQETAQDVLRRTADRRWRRAVTAAERAVFVEPPGEAAAAHALAEALEEVRR